MTQVVAHPLISKLYNLQSIITTSSNFEHFRTSEYVIKGNIYVDKTEQIYDNLLTSNDKYFFLARNRRTGKSLICSTLGEFFGRNKIFLMVYGYREKICGISKPKIDLSFT
jgi:hypothetical protein